MFDLKTHTKQTWKRDTLAVEASLCHLDIIANMHCCVSPGALLFVLCIFAAHVEAVQKNLWHVCLCFLQLQ